MKPADLLVAFVETIKATAPDPQLVETQADETTEETETRGEEEGSLVEEGSVTSNPTAETKGESEEDQILGTMGKPYEGVLRFLWTLHHRPLDIKAPSVGIITESDLLT